MGELADESVHLVVTSPPYWQIKDYGTQSQIGFNDTYESYVNNLNLVWNECSRVLHKGCRLCVNIGDQFARAVYYGRYKVIPIRTEIIKFCETIGLDYMGAIIWQKVTTCNTTGGATIMGSFPYPRNGIVKLDYEFILIFKKQGTPPKVSKDAKEASKLTTEEWNAYFAGHWNFPGERQDGHIAMFPEELPRRLIRMFTFVGETVLDPFLGSGTTSLAAMHAARNSVGYEINEEFLPMIEDKLDTKQPTMFSNAEFSVVRQKPLPGSFDERIPSLPYIFKDPLALDRKIDPKKLHFGSRIDKGSPARDQYHKVVQVLSPEILVLENGLKVRLLGVKEKPQTRQQAVDFLLRKTRGERVFLRFDSEKYDENGTLFCYLYLSNKTFLNAHLIKAGLAAVDERVHCKYVKRFSALEKAQ